MEVNTTFPEMTNQRRKAQFDYECADEMNRLTPEQRFKADFFYKLLDHAQISVQSRFQQIKDWNSIFGFLCRSDTLIKIHDTNQLQKHCLYLFEKMGDIETNELLMEISCFLTVIRGDSRLTTARDFLRYIYVNELNDFYPNLSIALRILLTTPCSNSG